MKKLNNGNQKKRKAWTAAAAAVAVIAVSGSVFYANPNCFCIFILTFV